MNVECYAVVKDGKYATLDPMERWVENLARALMFDDSFDADTFANAVNGKTIVIRAHLDL